MVVLGAKAGTVFQVIVVVEDPEGYWRPKGSWRPKILGDLEIIEVFVSCWRFLENVVDLKVLILLLHNHSQ